MRAVIQRVSQAAVAVEGREVARIGSGLLVLLAVGADDTEEDAAYVAEKTANLRIFPDEAGRLDRSLLDVGGEVLLVSQFTLYGDVRRGRRPSFSGAAPPGQAREAFERAAARFEAAGLTVRTGRFQEMMWVSLVNDGPVTIYLDSAERSRPRHA
ncbi:MAG: D-tyrosyl-tRNA(Tyr) deacylase [Dehalococcoidia bacterium]|nr:D-tyrosyl-tRNA(Tyr) deacylase [Dehalococcoidia bacterium]